MKRPCLVLDTLVGVLQGERCFQAPRALTNVLGILTASLHLGLVIWLGKRLFISSHLRSRPIRRVVQLWSVVRCLKHYRAVTKLLNKTILALNGRVRDFSDLVALEAVPPLIASGIDEVNDIQRIDKVDESISNVAVVREVDSQIHEIILAPARFIHYVLQHGLVNLIWDIPKHNCSTNIGAFSDFIDVDVIVVGARRAEVSSIDTQGVLAAII